ncbi:hypothetical protein ACQKNO_00365 [Bacillus paramycoides]|uniref:hypothetical protein n=1 Tax=Bacillus paramycoides TaxID=2026194 RepID=UPI003D041CD3
MLNKQFYSFKELDEIFSVQFTKKNGRSKLIKRNIEPYYIFDTVKEGRSQIGLKIIDYKRPEKSDFIKLCERISETEVKFPKESTAIKVLEVLFEEDCTILDNEEIGYMVPSYLERHTVGTYIKLFRKYKILPPVLPKLQRVSFDKETGEIFSKQYDPNKYTYYAVSRSEGIRYELEEHEYFAMRKFIDEKHSEYLTDFLLATESLDKEKVEAIEEYKKEAKRAAYSLCMREYGGVPKKTISKAPTKESFDIFNSYFNLSETA